MGNIAIALIAWLRNMAFTPFEELKTAVASALAAYNAEPFQKREDGSRLLAFEDGQRQLLRLLPEKPYRSAIGHTDASYSSTAMWSGSRTIIR